MTRAPAIAIGMVAVAGLVLACFRAPLLDDQQFSFRDASQTYYPLYLRVQQEWEAGRLPLWCPEENAGTPLLGNPTAAVLYPGKLVFAAVVYPWAMRLYVIGHVVLAVATMAGLARSVGTSRAGATIAGLAYGFGGPVLFQYSNLIFLVGAAWAPFALRGAVRLLVDGRPIGGVELAAGLALQVLGGDPLTAFLTGLAAAGLAVATSARPVADRRPRYVIGLIAIAWLVWPLIVAAARGGGTDGPGLVAKGLDALATVRLPIVLGGWGLAFVVLARARPGLGRRATWLAAAGLLAALVAAAQIVPAAEYAAESVRSADRSPMDVYSFSYEPWRLAGLAWPNVHGTGAADDRDWLTACFQVIGNGVWFPSAYLGGIAIVLSIVGASGRGSGNEPAIRRWLVVVALLAVWAAFGRFGGPLWWLRWLPGAEAWIGPHDPPVAGATRGDGWARDGLGGGFWFLSTLVPGFGSFRYPAKIWTIAALALSALAGLGWDRVAAGGGRRAISWAGRIGVGSIVAGLAAWWGRWAIAAAIAARGTIPTLDGPLAVDRTAVDVAAGLAHGGIALVAVGGLAWLARRRPGLAGPVAVALVAVDLAIANAGMVWTVPQAEFDREPAAWAAIERAERDDPATGPFRVHRMPIWYPTAFYREGSAARRDELFRWERDTLMPLQGLPLGVNYTLTVGVMERFDYLLFFRPFPVAADAKTAEFLGVPPGAPLNYYPRRGFDLWTTRYFVVPVRGLRWDDDGRGYASFLSHTDMIHPRLDSFADAGSRGAWSDRVDWQVLRNKKAFPRSWVVHEGRPVATPRTLDLASRSATMREILYQGDALWQIPGRAVVDPARTAWIEEADAGDLARSLPGGPPSEAEAVEVVAYESNRVELAARLERPGLVVLADAYAAGWRLEVDGVPATTWRVNRMMRGAAVAAGEHRLVFTYDPPSVKAGLAASGVGLLAMVGAWIAMARRDRGWAVGVGVR